MKTEEFDEVLKKTQSKSRGSKFCPVCGSKNVEWTLPQTWSKWICRNCDYQGALIIEDGKTAEAVRKRYEKSK